jgi:hypothetical protein
MNSVATTSQDIIIEELDLSHAEVQANPQTKFDAESPEQAIADLERDNPGTDDQPIVPTYYAGVTREIVAEIEYERDEVRKGNAATGKIMLVTGNRLRKIRAKLPRGQFGPWLAAEMPDICANTAQFYMNAAKYVADNPKAGSIQLLNPTVIGLLARPSTSEAARDEVLKRVENGNPPTASETRGIIHEHKAANENAEPADNVENTDTIVEPDDSDLDAIEVAVAKNEAYESQEVTASGVDLDAKSSEEDPEEKPSAAAGGASGSGKVTKPTKPTKLKSLAEIVKALVETHGDRAIRDELDKLAAAGKPKLKAA